MQPIDSGDSSLCLPPSGTRHTHVHGVMQTQRPPGSDLLIELTSVLGEQGGNDTTSGGHTTSNEGDSSSLVRIACSSLTCVSRSCFLASCSSEFFGCPGEIAIKRNEPPFFHCDECVKKKSPFCAICAIIYKMHVCQVGHAIESKTHKAKEETDLSNQLMKKSPTVNEISSKKTK